MTASGKPDDRHARIQVRAVPGAARTRVVGRYGTAWKIRIAAAPEKGRANVEICAYLAKLAGVHRNDVEVVTGTTSRDKLIDVQHVDLVTLEGMLDAASGN